MNAASVTVTGIIALFCGLFVALTGAIVVMVNPSRLVNRVFFCGATVIAINFLLIHQAIEAGKLRAVNGVSNPIPWLRAQAALIAFLPFILTGLRESIILQRNQYRAALLRSIPWPIPAF